MWISTGPGFGLNSMRDSKSRSMTDLHERYRQFLKKEHKPDTLKPEQEEFCHNLFDKYDFDCDGYLSRGELHELLGGLFRLERVFISLEQDKSALVGALGDDWRIKHDIVLDGRKIPARSRLLEEGEVRELAREAVRKNDDRVVPAARLKRALKPSLHPRLDFEVPEIKVPEFAADPRYFGTFCARAFNAHAEGHEDRMTEEEFCVLFEKLLGTYTHAMPQVKASKKEVKKQQAAISKAVEATTKEFEMLNLDEHAMAQIFKLFDKDQSGYLDEMEIKQIVKEMGIPDYERDGYKGFIKRNTRQVDDDASGEVEFEEFKKLLQSLVTCKIDRTYRQYILSQGRSFKKERAANAGKKTMDRKPILRNAASGILKPMS
mmetsp:Transcript_45489/g.103041  ORF Transcript_45489/g.103041 Transcript_45489/m.103041 type:complete len:376 (+) Transcript_45489:40-1167(+)